VTFCNICIVFVLLLFWFLLVLWTCHFLCYLFHCGRCQVNQRCSLDSRAVLASTSEACLRSLGDFHTSGLVVIFKRYLFR
jgi:hypothetical protein